MSRSDAWTLAEQAELDVDPNREPMHGWLEKNAWVQNQANQGALLDGFFSAIERERSLCFFYAKQTPLSDEHDRVLIGVGRVTNVGPTCALRLQRGRRSALVCLGSGRFALDPS